MPSYHTIADDLRRRITEGEWSVGDRLTAEASLAAHYQVSTPTLRQALLVLQSEGLIEKLHGSGNYVRQPRERLTYDGNRYLLRQQGPLHPKLKVAAYGSTTEASDAIASLLQIDLGSAVSEYVFTSSDERSVASVAHVYVPHQVARFGLPSAALPLQGQDAPQPALSPWGDDIRQMLSDAGVHVVSTIDRITARLPTTEEAKAMRTTAPVLAVERTSYDDAGHIVEGSVLVMPSSRAEAVFCTRARTMELESAG
ncbi:GntR family transcriptional regulator [Streptomyces sp. NPDC052396]|uniref:GntR family transcriptional regulator n=1 Tax=Streptomyces sp. NPDC052396 TaxID=3365689 RepID=UPI0037CDA96C